MTNIKEKFKVKKKTNMNIHGLRTEDLYVFKEEFENWDKRQFEISFDIIKF